MSHYYFSGYSQLLHSFKRPNVSTVDLGSASVPTSTSNVMFAQHTPYIGPGRGVLTCRID